jgi:branched-chain amino acid transport system substrate-binding protein
MAFGLCSSGSSSARKRKRPSSSVSPAAVMAQAAEAIKSTDPKKIAEYIHSGATFKTVIGDLKYDKKGDITRPDYVMYTWKKVGDKITYVEN